MQTVQHIVYIRWLLTLQQPAQLLEGCGEAKLNKKMPHVELLNII